MIVDQLTIYLRKIKSPSYHKQKLIPTTTTTKANVTPNTLKFHMGNITL